MKRSSLVAWGVGLIAVAAVAGLLLQDRFRRARYGGAIDAATWGASVAESDSAGMMAGLQAVALPGAVAAVAAIAGVVFLIAAAIRRT